MGIQTRKLEIEPYTYSVTQLDALKGRKAFVKLANVLGPAFRLATSSQAVIGSLLSGLREEDLEHFCDIFAANTCVSGGEHGDKAPVLTKALFMTHFAGDYGAMFEWLVFCVETNFSSFFPSLERMAAKYAPAAEPVKESQPESP